jgi:hypothetical protein
MKWGLQCPAGSPKLEELPDASTFVDPTMGLRDLTEILVFCVCRPAELPVLPAAQHAPSLLDLDDAEPEVADSSPVVIPAPVAALAASASQVPELSPVSMNYSLVLAALSTYSPHMKPGASKSLCPGDVCPNPRCREALLACPSSVTIGCKAGHYFSRPVLLSTDVSLSITALRRVLFNLLRPRHIAKYQHKVTLSANQFPKDFVLILKHVLGGLCEVSEANTATFYHHVRCLSLFSVMLFSLTIIISSISLLWSCLPPPHRPWSSRTWLCSACFSPFINFQPTPNMASTC